MGQTDGWHLEAALNRQGFTLIELLIVIAIIGILAASGTMNYARWRASSAVMEGAQQFAQAVYNTRTGAKRANACRQILLDTSDSTKYQIKEYVAPTATERCPTTPPPTSRTYSLPVGVKIIKGGATEKITFYPPYGTTDGSPAEFSVLWANNTAIQRIVRVTGVFGKVIIK